MPSYPSVFRSINFGRVTIPNRLVFLPMTTGLIDEKNGITDQFVDFYEQRAKGGTGLVEIGSAYICDIAGVRTQYPTAGKAAGIWADWQIEGWKRVADAIRNAGSKSAIQLQCCYEWREDNTKPLEAVGPSDGRGGPFVKHLRELSVDEIHTIIRQYGDAAERAAKAGFDIIEIHAGIGYLVSRFISSYSNKRTDEYGGTTAKRTRFLTDIIDEIRSRLGEAYPIMIRISADDFMPGGNRIPDTQEMIPIIEKHGVDAWSIQVGFHEAPKPLVTQFVEDASFTYAARECKKVTNKPIIASYRISTIDQCERVISSGEGDMVGMARQFIADPEFAIKAKMGHPEQIRQCIVCSRCLDNIFVGKKVQCSVNPQVANCDLNMGKTKPVAPGERKNVLVVGGGPGGMEAARTAAQRGHRVTLVERTGHLGGNLNMAQVLNEKLEPLNKWYQREVRSLPIDIRLKTSATPELTKELDPDVVIMAPGGKIIEPDAENLHDKKVISSGDLKKLVQGDKVKHPGLIWDLASIGLKIVGPQPKLMRLGMKMPVMIKKRVVVIGGGFAGCEVALEIMKNRDVTIVEEAPKIGYGIGIIDRSNEMNLIKEGGVKQKPGSRLVKVTPAGALIENIETHKQELLPADTVILALGVEPNRKLFDELATKYNLDVKDLYLGQKTKKGEVLDLEASTEQQRPIIKMVGDATTAKGEVKRTLEAISGGYRAAMSI